MAIPPDIQEIINQLDSVEHDARALTQNLTPEQAAFRPSPGAWNVPQILDHLATTNRTYLTTMRPAADRARRDGRLRRGPARASLTGRWIIRTFEPPIKNYSKIKAPQAAAPRQELTLADALAAFLAVQDEIRSFLRETADLDLAGIRFPNPFVRIFSFTLATGLLIIAAHERRHLWQMHRLLDAST